MPYLAAPLTPLHGTTARNHWVIPWMFWDGGITPAWQTLAGGGQTSAKLFTNREVGQASAGGDKHIY